MLASYYLKRRDVSELLLNFYYFNNSRRNSNYEILLLLWLPVHGKLPWLGQVIKEDAHRDLRGSNFCFVTDLELKPAELALLAT